jgi:antitoxin component YwqK of YwqJK toxin-antitoxin module
MTLIFSKAPKLWRSEIVAIKRQGGKMNLAKFRLLLPFILLLAGCSLGSLQQPPGSTPYSTLQSQATSQRGQHVLDKALEGMLMGASLGGLYGAGGGLVIGLLTGLFTADAHYAQLTTQIQSEQAKDKELEAKIEQELQRQRELEAQIANSAGHSAKQNQAESLQPVQNPISPNITKVAMNGSSVAVASLTKNENPSNSLSQPFKNVEVRDINNDGTADLWIYYNPINRSEIVRQEEATHWDGRVDTWSYFKDGNLVRREVDTKRRGTADTVYFYENDKIVREERYENGTAHVSFRAIYQNGRRARLEEDTKGRGKTDRWIYYDTAKQGEIVLKEESDLNGDGTVDLWSYYENGRLVRRDVSAVGLELLSEQDQIPAPPAEPKNSSFPQLVRDDRRRN